MWVKPTLFNQLTDPSAGSVTNGGLTVERKEGWSGTHRIRCGWWIFPAPDSLTTTAVHTGVVDEQNCLCHYLLGGESRPGD
ncbi:hypothetical protein CW304_32945 [Bacillus sp. UFRGS-B20]|nr:hypothetical protein CW304_32945 [Bacillus sp. UFRGS-B20]